MATPAQRSLAAGTASLKRWSRIHGPVAREAATSKARAAVRSKWEQQVLDEARTTGRELTQAEIDTAVDCLQRAHYKRMALASAAKRRRTA